VSTGAEARFPGVGSAGCVGVSTLPRTLTAEVTGDSFPQAKLFTNLVHRVFSPEDENRLLAIRCLVFSNNGKSPNTF
jgi:hypothetical protein